MPPTATATVLDEERMQRMGMADHARLFNLNIGVILQGLDAAIGSYVYNDKNMGKTIADLIPKEKVRLARNRTGSSSNFSTSRMPLRPFPPLPAARVALTNNRPLTPLPSCFPPGQLPLVDVAKAIFHVVPQVMPAAESEASRLYTVLAVFSTHVNMSVASEAAQAIQRLAAQCPQRRIPLLLALGAFVLSLSDRLPKLQQQTLALYLNVLRTLTRDHVGLHDGDPSVVEDAERVALIFCCSYSPAVRVLAMDVLRTVGALGTPVRAQESLDSKRALCRAHNCAAHVFGTAAGADDARGRERNHAQCTDDVRPAATGAGRPGNAWNGGRVATDVVGHQTVGGPGVRVVAAARARDADVGVAEHHDRPVAADAWAGPGVRGAARAPRAPVAAHGATPHHHALRRGQPRHCQECRRCRYASFF